MQSGEEVKLAFKITGVPTLPAGDGLDEAGWAPFNPKWRLVIYNEEGGEVRILSGQAASMGVNQIPLEVTWDGKDSQGNPAEAGNYTYKLFCLEQSDGLGYGVAQGNLTVEEEPVLEIYNEDDELIASSEDPEIAMPFPPYEYYSPYPAYVEDLTSSTTIASRRNFRGWFNQFLGENPHIEKLNISDPKQLAASQSKQYILLRQYKDTPTQLTIKKINSNDNSQQQDLLPYITVLVKSEKSNPTDKHIKLYLQNDGKSYKGTFTVGSQKEGANEADIIVSKISDSYTVIDIATEYTSDAEIQDKINPLQDSFAFCDYYNSRGGTKLGFAFNNSKPDCWPQPPLSERNVMVSNNAIIAAGYEDVVATYNPDDNIIRPITARFHVANQAEKLYYEGHGNGSGTSVIGIFAVTNTAPQEMIEKSRFDPAKPLLFEELWMDNLNNVILNCCEVLDIGNFNGKRKDYNSPGRIWGNILSQKHTSTILGFNENQYSLDLSDPQHPINLNYAILVCYFNELEKYKNGPTQDIIDKINNNPLLENDEKSQIINKDFHRTPEILAWLMANANFMTHNDPAAHLERDGACGFETGKYYYFIKYDRVQFQEKEWQQYDKRHYYRKIIRIPKTSNNWDMARELKQGKYQMLFSLPDKGYY